MIESVGMGGHDGLGLGRAVTGNMARDPVDIPLENLQNIYKKGLNIFKKGIAKIWKKRYNTT